MFTGIVETVGKIAEIHINDDCKVFKITSEIYMQDSNLGDSISVNGVCLTITQFSENTFFVLAVPETLRLSNLSQLHNKSIVNLERAMQVGSRVGGHYVQGHVDLLAEILAIEKDGDAALIVKISLPKNYRKYLIKKGFVAVDGMSLTVTDLEENCFSVCFVPYTVQHTIVRNYQVGNKVNVEVDMMAKYIENFMGA